jgi:hypothetical protein
MLASERWKFFDLKNHRTVARTSRPQNFERISIVV